MDESPQKTVEHHIKRYDKLKSQSANWDSHYQDLANYFLPRKGNILVVKSDGSKQYEQIYDTTGEDALEFFATGFYNKMTPSTQRWFLLQPNYYGEDAEEFNEVLGYCTDIALEQINISNFKMAIYEDYLDLGLFGMGNLFIDKGNTKALNYATRHISEYVICENAEGIVDTVYYMHKFTARQAVEKFGYDNVGKKVQNAYDSTDGKDIDKKFEFLHVIEPNKDYFEGSRIIDNWHMPISTLWIAKDDKKLVSKSGYWKMRSIVHRFAKGTGEIRGRSPAMRKLPDNKLVNKIMEIVIKNGEQKIAPSILSPAGAFDEEPMLVPNGILNYRVEAGMDKFKPEPWNTGADVKLGIDIIQLFQKSITRGLYNELFMILEDDKTRTATEVLEVAQNKLELLGPNQGRLQAELFDPLVEVSVDLLARQGKFPFLSVPMSYKIEYVSTLALALRFSEVKAFANTMAYIGPFAEMDPSILDQYKLSDISRGIGEAMGVPHKWMRSGDEVRAIQQARIEAQQKQAALQIAQGAAEAVPKLSKTIEEGSPLDSLRRAYRYAG